MRNLDALHEANETATIADEATNRLPVFRTERARRVARQVYEAIADRRHLVSLNAHDEHLSYALGAIRGAIILATEIGDTATEHAVKVLLQRLNDRGFDGLDELFGAATLVA